ncbi:MAG TPA: thiamine pyrophosphate-dependent enzyme [Alphaproteobacteria bacterium]|nr:thiamine pyrophosphate-dependent enzyme [Alphaproteobacteria bacterium]
MMNRDDVLRTLAKHRTDELVLTTMSTAQEWPAYSQSEFDFNARGTGMGHLPDMGLGLAVACPQRKVLVLNGDGSMLMNLGVLVTIGNAAPRNLILFVFQNDIYEVTGGQPIPGKECVNFAVMAKGAGFPHVFEFDELSAFDKELPHILKLDGPVFVTVKAGPSGKPLSTKAVPVLAAARALRETLSKAHR